jgi:GLPGLI family protein
MKRIISILALVVVSMSGMAQYVNFVTDGVIEYEKRVNMYALMQKRIAANPTGNTWQQQFFDQYKKTKPQFMNIKSTLAFSGGKSLYKTTDDTPPVNDIFGITRSVDMRNVIFADLLAGTSISQKNVYEETFLVKDSLRRINWKITDETREIAGYQCRRANALIMDSIYVVAFYTDEIIPSGGPESFSGLPGMILGVAMPYEHVTWFATKVSTRAVTANELLPPAKGKSITNADLRTKLEAALKNWGADGKTMMKSFML